MINNEEVIFFGYGIPREKMYLKGWCKTFKDLEYYIDEERVMYDEEYGDSVIYKFVRLVSVQYTIDGIIYVAEYKLE